MKGFTSFINPTHASTLKSNPRPNPFITAIEKKLSLSTASIRSNSVFFIKKVGKQTKFMITIRIKKRYTKIRSSGVLVNICVKIVIEFSKVMVVFQMIILRVSSSCLFLTLIIVIMPNKRKKIPNTSVVAAISNKPLVKIVVIK